MNGAQLHLLLNHLPVVTCLIGTLTLLLSFLKGFSDTQKFALWLLLLSALLAIPAYFSGKPAESVAKNYPGTIRILIHEHEEAAFTSLMMIETLGIACFLILLQVKPEKPLSRFTLAALILFSLFSFGTIARAAHLGGLIRHEEIRPEESIR